MSITIYQQVKPGFNHSAVFTEAFKGRFQHRFHRLQFENYKISIWCTGYLVSLAFPSHIKNIAVQNLRSICISYY